MIESLLRGLKRERERERVRGRDKKKQTDRQTGLKTEGDAYPVGDAAGRQRLPR